MDPRVEPSQGARSTQSGFDPCGPPLSSVVASELRGDIERTLRSRHPNRGKRLLALEDTAKSAGASFGTG